MGQIKTIYGIIGRFHTNWQGYLRTYWLLLVLTFLTAVADMFTTIHFMLIEGPQTEGHPAIRLLSMILGPVFGPLIGKFVQLGVIVSLTVYLRRGAVYIFVTVIIIYTWAAWYNIWGQSVYYPRILKLLEYLSS